MEHATHQVEVSAEEVVESEELRGLARWRDPDVKLRSVLVLVASEGCLSVVREGRRMLDATESRNSRAEC